MGWEQGGGQTGWEIGGHKVMVQRLGKGVQSWRMRVVNRGEVTARERGGGGGEEKRGNGFHVMEADMIKRLTLQSSYYPKNTSVT